MEMTFAVNYRQNRRADAGVTLISGIWFCGILNYILPNHGGAGLNLPQNLLAWSAMALIGLWCLYRLPQKREVALPSGTLLVMAGILLWSLPLLWTPRADWRLNALPRVLALWGMAGFWLLLLYATSGIRLRARWLLILVTAALMQAGWAVWQFFQPDVLAGGRPYGSFQQVNVLASFIATGVVCALWLFLHNRRYRWVSAVAVLILPAVLVILQSRAGSLGAASGVILLSLSKWSQQKRRITTAFLLITAGIGIGLAGLHLINVIYPDFSVIVDKENSTSARIYMLKLTWQLILTHPIMGCGYGSFESLFGQLAQITPPGLEADTMQYPHNELLYAWVEGGIVAVIGILLIVFGILKRLWGKGGTKYAGVALLLPLAIHTNLEYPLYQSATHCLTLIMLLVISGRQIVTTHEDEIKQPYRVWRIPAGILTVAILLFMITGLQTQARITKIEQQGLMPLAVNEQAELKALLNPYSQYERLEFDRHVAMLLKFNLTRDPALLEQFRHWAEAYLELHNDPSVYASLLMIARAYHQPNAENICQQARGRWLSDPRFVCAEKK